jgi:anti-sigma factor RsiW
METIEPQQPAGDPDFELLGSYLDGELSAAEALRVEQRLLAEPELAAALGRMNAEFEIRHAAYKSLEPDARAVDALASSVGRQVRRMERSHRRLFQIGRLAGALAACVAISFAAGWIGRGYAAGAAARKGPPTATTEEPYVYQVALTDDKGNITAVQKFDKLEDAKAFAADVGRWQAEQAKQTGTSATSLGL